VRILRYKTFNSVLSLDVRVECHVSLLHISHGLVAFEGGHCVGHRFICIQLWPTNSLVYNLSMLWPVRRVASVFGLLLTLYSFTILIQKLRA